MSSIVKVGSFSKIKRNDGKVATADHISERRDFIIRQAIKKSQYIDNEATERANALIESTYRRCHLIMMEAERKGYEEGYAKGLADGEKYAEEKAQDGLNEIYELIESIKAEQKEAIERQEKDLLMIAFAIAKKIMRNQAQSDQDFLQKILGDVILENQENLRIYISEYNKTLDMQMDKNLAKRIQNQVKNTKVIMVGGDDVIMAETENGMVDMSLQVQLQKLGDLLNGCDEIL
ncbi:MAG: FliH/SctL family protein [Eubacteriales bacterium]|nr:FliH/SctL family protein [Eubacteriales bacterium]